MRRRARATQHWLPDFERMRKLAVLMNKRREERGSIDFDLPEPVIEFDEQGQMRGVTKSERTWANRLIEEFMLAANECVATWLEDLGVPSLYRIHEKPEPRRVVQFEELAASFGYSLGLGALPVKRIQTRGDRRDAHARGRNPRMHEVPEDIPVTPRMYQKLAARIEGKPEERILSYLMLRSLRQARYSEINEGHFALAAPTLYALHFAHPPLSRSDCASHRQGAAARGRARRGRQLPKAATARPGRIRMKALPRAIACPTLGADSAAARQRIFASEPPIPEAELAQIAEETSQTERRAAEAERELVEWKKVRFMQDRVGEEFAALVLNPAKYGLFVELTDLFVEGLVPIDSLRDDRYTWRENTHEIIGERIGPPLPRRRPRAGDSGPHPGPGTQAAVLDCRRGNPADRQEGCPSSPGPKPGRSPRPKKKDKRRNAGAPAFKSRKQARQERPKRR